MSETEKIRFKLLNRLVKHKLIITSSGCWVKEGTNIRKYTTVKFNKKYFKLHVLSAIIFLNHDFEI